MSAAIEQKAWRAARREGFVARKSRKTNRFMLVDPRTNIPVAGFEYDLTVEEVLSYCNDA